MENFLFALNTVLPFLLYIAFGYGVRMSGLADEDFMKRLNKVIFQPLFDLPYYPIMMQTIDAVVKIEKRNEYTYILSHEFGLFLGRAFGLILFMVLAFVISQDFALKYALILVGALQLIAYPLARNIIRQNQAIR